MKTNLKQSIGLRVKVARRAQRISQQQLAERIERTTETVSNIERAVSTPNIETLERLSQALEIPLVEFFATYNSANTDQKRLRMEIDIRQCVTQLSVTQLETARIQIQALVDMGEG